MKEDNLSTTDKMDSPKRVHYTEVPLHCSLFLQQRGKKLVALAMQAIRVKIVSRQAM